MKIAVIGSGISGLTCAHYLSKAHDITVFESAPRIGGHTATVDVQLGPRRYAIDTGFIVYNDWTYPNFIQLLNEIGVSSKATSMGFSVKDSTVGLEYSGSSLDTLFAQRRNLMSPKFIRMVRDILAFNKDSQRDLESGALRADETLGEYLQRKRYSESFRQWYLIPMAAAIWSASWQAIESFPALFFLRFFKNHGLLNIKNRPQWRVIDGGSREYIAPLTARFADKIITKAAVTDVERRPTSVRFKAGGQTYEFDQIVIATHSDQALAMLKDATATEKAILGAIPYQTNDVVLHTDDQVLPRNRKTWTSWNYSLTPDRSRAVVTYNMNILQGIQAPETFCVTLNQTHGINPNRILGRFSYDHPVFSLDGIAAQERWDEINGVNNTWYCGAYWHNGFHEDGVNSALRIAQAIPKQARAAA
ncbi:NAD(P)/FAD-dependent oxidoreductase [Aequoribacter sp.]|uniref:NAD(P)/FAD-dependent oxidoreductase n=1 Tax=Aequoribacter sp. TaxID=2847771 RepID=UPI003F6A3E13